MAKDIVITAAVRTPIGGFQGQLSGLTAPQLGGLAIAGALEKSGVKPPQIDEVYMGNVLAAGLGQAPARQASLLGGLTTSTPCNTISKVCGSGMKAVMVAADQLRLYPEQILVAGGMESMSQAPYLLPKARAGYRLGHGEVKDHMFLDGLEDAYTDETKGRLMGTFAEDCAEHYQFTRQAQDDYAVTSTTRAVEALNRGVLVPEILPVTLTGKQQGQVVSSDEQPQKSDLSKIAKLKPAFKKDGTVTAANASSISDGAAALILTSADQAQKNDLPILARIVGQASYAAEPKWFTTAPIGAMKKLLSQVGWTTADVDLFEINEAFAVVVMAAISEMTLDPARVNIHGGAVALGHPIGASGARIVVTLIHALRQYGLKRGIASLCIGGGEATALAIELP